MRYLILILLLTNISIQGILAQEKCATVPYAKQLKDQGTVIETELQFEEWLQETRENRKAPRGTEQTQAGPYQVPVVVHVIHNGEPIGTGTNISDEQILSQLSVINKDFNRLNTDAVNTPGEFTSVAGSMDIEFVLAKRNPEGGATTGIVRKKGAKSLWSVGDNYQLKSQSYWPAEDYLNLWVTNISGVVLGYAQFPVSNLPGLENSSTNRLTDGVVIDYRAFGSIDDNPDFVLESLYNKGRTLTHELSHFFGLRHIWGDDEDGATCNGTDYVDDTPNQSLATEGCPAHPRPSCSSNDMFMNFQDYTSDACMNLFTAGQVNRMITVIENSPRRVSLLTSPALEDPVPLPNDAGIAAFINPALAECSPTVVPSATVYNYGNNNITSVQVQFRVDDATLETKTFTTNLAPGQETDVVFASKLLAYGYRSIEYRVTQTNGGADANSGNNSLTYTSLVATPIGTPFSETFNTIPSNWSISNPDQLIGWALKTAPNASPTNKALYMNFYDYEGNTGESDFLVTPVFDLTSVPAALMFFKVAHAQFETSRDGLRVYVLADCEGDVYKGTLVYEKFGSALATASATGSPFVPNSESQWRQEVIHLTPFAGKSRVQVAFVGINDYGNNLYLDDVNLITDAKEDLALTVVAPRLLNCSQLITPTFEVRNSDGSVSINSYKINVSNNGGAIQSITRNTTLAPGESETITLTEAMWSEGMNTMTVSISEPNGAVDIDPSNSTYALRFAVNSSTDYIPLRKNFDESQNTWTIVSSATNASWKTVETNYGKSLSFDGYANTVLNDSSWLFSPGLNLTTSDAPSVFFDVSHAAYIGKDTLRVFATRDCGQTFEELESYADLDLNVIGSTAAWLPSQESDWMRKYISLSSFIGEADVHLAFKAINGNENMMYLDNIEFFTSGTEEPKVVAPPFQVYGTSPSEPGDFNITFNLEERSTVGYEVLDVMGKRLVKEEIPFVLNQTYTVDAGAVATGIYILHLRIGDKHYATKLFLSGTP